MLSKVLKKCKMRQSELAKSSGHLPPGSRVYVYYKCKWHHQYHVCIHWYTVHYIQCMIIAGCGTDSIPTGNVCFNYLFVGPKCRWQKQSRCSSMRLSKAGKPKQWNQSPNNQEGRQEQAPDQDISLRSATQQGNTGQTQTGTFVLKGP